MCDTIYSSLSVGKMCYVCLNNQSNVVNVGAKDESKQKILLKLQICVPEVKWDLSYFICNSCLSQLNTVYNFRTLCIESDKKRKSDPNLLQCEVNNPFPNTDDLKLENSDDFDNNCSDSKFDTNYDSVDSPVSEKQDLGEQFQCNQCNNLYKSKKLVENHIRKAHCVDTTNNKRKYVCDSCKKSYISKVSFNKHVKTCKGGGEIISESSVLEKPEISNVCDICGATFSNKYLVKRHKRNVHATEKKYKCEICPQTFVSAVYLNAHKRYHSRERSHICSFCGKGFITASDLYHHEKIHANKREYRCETCDKAFNTSSDLHKHKICVHMDRSLWKYVCDFCERRFPLKTNLVTHIKTHTGEKNFSCHLCDTKCINRSVLMRHIDTHSNVRAFKCSICLQGYKYKKSLNIHLVKAHGIGDIKLPVKVKNFFCHICPKSYFANNKLQKHIRSHTGDRPFKCTHCEKCFIDKSYVKQHLKTTHGVVDNSVIYNN